jgi:hypothetical protein
MLVLAYLDAFVTYQAAVALGAPQYLNGARIVVDGGAEAVA